MCRGKIIRVSDNKAYKASHHQRSVCLSVYFSYTHRDCLSSFPSQRRTYKDSGPHTRSHTYFHKNAYHKGSKSCAYIHSEQRREAALQQVEVRWGFLMFAWTGKQSDSSSLPSGCEKWRQQLLWRPRNCFSKTTPHNFMSYLFNCRPQWETAHPHLHVWLPYP